MTATDEPTLDEILDSEPKYHPVLEVWLQVLTSAENISKAKVSPAWAARIVGNYKELSFNDMNHFRDKYYDRLAIMKRIVEDEIRDDAEALKRVSPADDVEHNALHYKNIIRDWQLAIVWWEISWDCADPFAAIDYASLVELQRMFFDNTGMANLIDQIDLPFDESDRAILDAAIAEFRQEKGEGVQE